MVVALRRLLCGLALPTGYVVLSHRTALWAFRPFGLPAPTKKIFLRCLGGVRAGYRDPKQRFKQQKRQRFSRKLSQTNALSRLWLRPMKFPHAKFPALCRYSPAQGSPTFGAIESPLPGVELCRRNSHYSKRERPDAITSHRFGWAIQIAEVLLPRLCNLDGQSSTQTRLYAGPWFVIPTPHHSKANPKHRLAPFLKYLKLVGLCQRKISLTLISDKFYCG